MCGKASAVLNTEASFLGGIWELPLNNSITYPLFIDKETGSEG